MGDEMNESTQASAARRLAVLVVEDCEDNAALLAELVTSLGHQVHVARTGTEAIQASQERRSDVVFLDLGLPDVDGYEVARRIRSLHPEQCHIVALTGFSDAGRRNTARAAGCSGFLVKPVRFTDLQRALIVSAQ
jgi:CheY-like chemotaxis protein